MREAVLKYVFLSVGLATGIIVGGSQGLWSVISLQPAAAADNAGPHIVPIPLNTPATERLVYPPQVAVGNFDGAYKEATV